MVKPCSRCGGTDKLADGRCKPCRRNRERANRVGKVLATPQPPRIVVPPGLRDNTESPPQAQVYRGALPRRLICDGDIHYPIHDPYVTAAKLKFAADFRPDAWVNIGDCYDFWPISSHEKEPERWFDGKGRLQDEFDSAKPYWREVCRVTSGDIHFILGNHENRLYRLIGANLGLFKLDAFEWQTLASLPDRVKVHAYKTQLRIGPLCFEHGDKIGGKFGVKHPAAWLLENKGNRNTIFGHTHRIEVKQRTVFDELGEPHSYTAINQGHGSDVREQKYIYEPSWQHGFTAVEFWYEGEKPRFSAYPITVVAGRFSFGGKLYDGRKA